MWTDTPQDLCGDTYQTCPFTTPSPECVKNGTNQNDTCNPFFNFTSRNCNCGDGYYSSCASVKKSKKYFFSSPEVVCCWDCSYVSAAYDHIEAVSYTAFSHSASTVTFKFYTDLSGGLFQPSCKL